MLTQTGLISVLCLCVLSGCALYSGSDDPPRVRDVHIHDRNHIVPDRLYAAVGEEIGGITCSQFPFISDFLGSSRSRK